MASAAMSEWDVDEVAAFVGAIDPACEGVFERHRVTGAMLCSYTFKDLVLLGVPNGPAAQIRRTVQKYNKDHPPQSQGLVGWLWSMLPTGGGGGGPATPSAGPPPRTAAAAPPPAPAALKKRE